MAGKDKKKIGSIDAMVDDVTKHDLDVVRFEENMVAKSHKELKHLKQELIKDTATGFPSKTKNVALKRKKAAQLVKQSKTKINKTYSTINRLSQSELGHLAAIEGEFSKGLINNYAGGNIASKKASDDAAKKLARDIAIQGSPAAMWWGRQSTALQNKFTDKILQAVQGNWTIDQVIEGIRGTEAASFKDGIMHVSEIQAEALARTSVQTITNASRLATLNANQDVIESMQWIATLDGRTSSICMNLNGKKWSLPEYQPIGHGIPFPGPTAHWRCRSTQIPITYPFNKLPKKKQALVHPQAKAAMGDSLKESVTFSKFLSKLPDRELITLFGNEKLARQFKRGKLTEAEALKLASQKPIDTNIMKQNLAALGISSFDDINPSVFTGRSITDAEKLIVNAPNEIALIAKNNKKIDKVIVGETSSVEFDWFTRKDLFNSTLTHNHGAASSFSTADIELFFKYKPKQFRIVMPVNDLQAGFLGATTTARQATLILEKIDNGPDISTKELMRRIKEEREIYFKAILDAGDNTIINETQSRFATYMALRRVSDDVPGFRVKTEFSNGRIGVPENVDDIIDKLTKERQISVVEPETVVLTRAKKLGLDVESDVIAEARVRGILKEMHPNRDSARFDLNKAEVWNAIRTFTNKNPEALKLPLNQFEQGATFNALRYAYSPDIRESGGPSNVAWINESLKQVFRKAKVDSTDPTRQLSLKERFAIQQVIDSDTPDKVFGFKEVNKIAADAAESAKVRNQIAVAKADERIALRTDTTLQKKLTEYRIKLNKEANALRAAKERLQRALDADDVNRILHARADIAELESVGSIIGGGLKAPKLKTRFTPVPRFTNEKHVSAAELPDLDQSVRAATGKAKPVREAALAASDKVKLNYDKAYQDFIHMDITEFDDLLNKSIRGDLLSEHESLVISRGIAAASSKYSMLKDNFKPKSFEELFSTDNKRKMLTNYQAYVAIDTKLKRVRSSNIFKKAPVDPITGQPAMSIAEENLLNKSMEKLLSKPTVHKKYGKGFMANGVFVPEQRMDLLIDLIDEGKYIIGQNRVEPMIQGLVRFADPDFDWKQVKNFKAMMNGTKTVPGVYHNRILQYADKLKKEWEASKNVSINSTIALAKKSEAGVNAISKEVQVSGPAAIEATKMSKRMKSLIRYHNLSDDELLLHELVNEQRLASENIKDWTARIKRPQQNEIIRKSADGDIVVLEPLDLRKKVFRDLNLAISDQRNDTKIAEVNKRIGRIILDARIYKQAKTNLAGKLDMTIYEDAWETARTTGKTDMNLFEYGLNEKLKALSRLKQKDIDLIYAKANAKIDDAYRVSLKSPKRALSLNNLDDQKLVALANSTQAEATRERLDLITRGRRAAKELLVAAPKEGLKASSYGQQLAKDLLQDAYRTGSSFDPVSVRMGAWIKGSRHSTEDLADKILMSIIDAELSQGAMGPMAHQIGAMMAKNAGISGIAPEIAMQVGARVIQQAEKQGFIKRSMRPILNKDGEPIRDAAGNFKQAWHIDLANDKLKSVALSEPNLRRFSKLPQSTPPKFDPDRPWEYEDGTSIAKVFDKDVLQRVYAPRDTIYRKAIEAKTNTPFTIDHNTTDFYDKLRASGLKNAEGETIIPSWDLSISPKSAAGLTSRSKTVQWNNIHAAAKAIRGEEQLYFKYTSDFRGRSYASGVVTPQGPPQAKSYFRFKEPTPIKNAENAKHYWLDMSTRAGHDKLPKTKADYEDWTLVKDSYGADAAKRRLTGQEYGFEVVTPKFAKIWDDIESGRFWKDKKYRTWIDEYEEEWPEVFAASGEINQLRKHVEKKTGKKLFKVNPDGSYAMALDRNTVETAMKDYKPTLIPHIDGTTNAYQQMGMMTRDDDLGLIANLRKGHKLYDAYYYTGLTIKQSDNAVVAAAVKRDNPALYERARKKLSAELANKPPEEVFGIVGDYLKAKHFSEYDQSRRKVQKALDIKKQAVEAMPEVFGEDATVNIVDLRAMFKKPVMLQPYGASMTTILNAIKKEGWKIAKKDPEKFKFLSEGDNAKLIGQAVIEMNPIFYPKAREYQNFLKDLVRRHNDGVFNPVSNKYVTGADGRPIPVPMRYKLPNGVELNLDYKEALEVPVEVSIGNQTGWLTTQIHTDKIKSSKQISAVAANMTHAHDAAWDHMWTDILADKGVKNFIGIHDAAGTDFGNMDKLHDAWRQAGVKLYQDYDLFDNLLKQAAERGVNIKGLKPPKMGTLNVKELLDSEYAIH